MAAGLITLAVGGLCLDYFYFPPVGTFELATVGEWVALLCYVILDAALCLAVESFRGNVRRRQQRDEEAASLGRSAERVLGARSLDEALGAVAREAAGMPDVDGAAIDVLEDGRWRRAAVVGTPPPGPDRSGPEPSPLAIPLRSASTVHGLLRLMPSPGPLRQQADVAAAFAAQAALALERERVRAAEVQAEVLREENRFRREFLANISHDLRTPLTAVEVATSALQSEELLRGLAFEGRQELVTVAVEEVGRLHRMVESLDQLTHLESRQLAPQLQLVDLGDLAREAAEGAAHRNISVAVTVDEPVTAPLDRDLALRVLDNLISNAVRFAPESDIELIGLGNEIRVVDHGPGVRPSDRDRIFDRFYRARRDRREGAGLGLAIAKGIMDAHGGSIRYEDTYGGGATFVVTFRQ
jgi:two-component system sensor histidine kinase KdpD